MEQEIIQIGNSKGIRIPAPFLKEVGIKKYVDISIKETPSHEKQLVITGKKSSRKNWMKQFDQKTEPENLIPDNLESSWEKDEWSW